MSYFWAAQHLLNIFLFRQFTTWWHSLSKDDTRSSLAESSFKPGTSHLTWVLLMKYNFKRFFFFFFKVSNVRKQVPCGVHFLVGRLQEFLFSGAPHQLWRGRVRVVLQQQSCLMWLETCTVENEKEKTVFHWGKSKAFLSITDLIQILFCHLLAVPLNKLYCLFSSGLII